MDTHPPAMTTEDLLAACADAGLPISGTRLARWVKQGLIPPGLRTARGRGRGLGKEWLWQPEALARALIIAGTVRADGDPSLTRSAGALATAGYAPGASALRTILLAALDAAEALAARRQTYLDMPLTSGQKRQRHTRMYRQRNPQMPDTLTSLLDATGAALHGLAPATEDDKVPASPFPPLPSFATARDRLTSLDDAALLAAYEDAGRMLPNAIPVWFGWLNMLLLPLLALRFPADVRKGAALPGPVDVDATVASLHRLSDGRVVSPPDSPAGTLRMLMTLAMAAIPLDTDTMGRLKEYGQQVLSGLAAFVGQSDRGEGEVMRE